LQDGRPSHQQWLQPAAGDLIASGTTSRPTDDSRACCSGDHGARPEPITLPNGEKRSCSLTATRSRSARTPAVAGFASIGFGECKGRIEPAVAWPAGGKPRGGAG